MAKQKNTTPVAKQFSPDQQGILAAVREAWIAEHDAEATHVASFSATTVARIIEARKAKLTRNDIATALGTTTGGLSRHILLSKHETAVKLADGRSFPSVVTALQSGAVSVNGLYALLAPTSASKTKGGKMARSLNAALRAMLSRETKYKTARETVKVEPLSVRSDMIAAVTFLLSRPTFKLSTTDVEAIVGMIPAPVAEPVDEARKAA